VSISDRDQGMAAFNTMPSHQEVNGVRREVLKSEPSLFSAASGVCLTTLNMVFDRIGSDQARHSEWLQGSRSAT
jgi:hypothetical protein